MVEERHLGARLVVEGYGLVQYREVTRLLYISGCTEDQPERVIVKAAPNLIVSFPGEGLVLVVAGAIGELRGGDVDDPLAGPLGDLMYKAKQILVGVAEAHAASDTALEVRCGAGEAEGDHALVLVPDVHHPVQPLLLCLYTEAAQQLIPVSTKPVKSAVYLLHVVETGNCSLCLALVDDALV